jgi:hypothetical protein
MSSWARSFEDGMRVGERLGGAFAQRRYDKEEARVRQAYEAGEFGDGPEALEKARTELRNAMQSTRALRAHGRDAEGVSFAERGAAGLEADALRRSNREAAGLAASGDYRGALRGAGRSATLQGDVAGASRASIGAETIDVTTGAVGADGNVDQVGLARGMTGLAARTGDAAGVESGGIKIGEKGRELRNAYLGQVMQLATDPNADMGQVAAVFQKVLPMIPALAGAQVQVDAANPGGFHLITRGGRDIFLTRDEIVEYASDQSLDVDKLAEQTLEARRADAAATRESQRGLQGKIAEAKIRIIEAFGAKTPEAERALSVVVDSGAKARQAGWELMDSTKIEGDGGPNRVLAKGPDGQIYTMIYGPGAVGPDGTVAPNEAQQALQVFDERGQPVNMADIKAAEPLAEYAIALAAAQNVEQLRIDQAYLTTKLNALDAVFNAGGGGGGGSAPAQDPKYTERDPNWRAPQGNTNAPTRQGALGGFLGQPTTGPKATLPAVQGSLDAIDRLDQRQQWDGAIEEATRRTTGLESGGRADAKNPRSSATGRGQFIDSTWLAMVSKYRPDLAEGRSKEGILALRTDGALSDEMTANYGRENAAVLDRAGLTVTPQTLYIAHHFGAQGAVKILSADPETPMAQLVSARELAANPHLKGKTVGQVLSDFERRAGGGGAVASARRSAPAAAAAPTRGADPQYASLTANIDRALGAG